jgi:hypothetical protein
MTNGIYNGFVLVNIDIVLVIKIVMMMLKTIRNGSEMYTKMDNG